MNEAMNERYRELPESELATLDAALAPHEHRRWQAFYVDRARPCPFFGMAPDENLHAWVTQGQVPPGAALDVGCGNARNAIFLARQGFVVQAVDFSASAMAWAREAVAEAGVPVTLHEASVFELALGDGGFSFVYDSGCFHHMAPHRRHSYVQRIAQLLAPGGLFGLVCFAPEGGSGLSDDQVYAEGTLGGGLGYEAEQLQQVWGQAFEPLQLRRMHEQAPGSGLFGKDFLWTMLARKR